MNNLDMLMRREQLMEDISFIVEDYCGGDPDCEELVKKLCDAVCENFPTQK